ncbi:MAG: O-antigen ligase family protein [Actinomycetia bacterium]|nr:O-antigen ligase family protein [Actinomycetes bacterium]MCP5034339.1 O-antigen ligase family protein [Actinomycetes bacterium]
MTENALRPVPKVGLSDRPEIYDGQGDELGPVATFGAQVIVFVSIIFIFNVTGFVVFPGMTPLALFMGTLGVVMLAPRLVLMRLPVSLLVLLLVGWMLASTLWTDSPEGTAFAILRLMPIVAGMAIICGLISLRDLVPALLWSIRFSVVLTLAVVAALPETRIHIDPTGLSPDLDGWHGWFPHKNIMTPFLVFGLVTVLTFDRTRLMKLGTLALIGILFVGSDSVTGISSAMLVVSVWVWIQLYQNLDIRNSSVFVISSASVGLFAILGVVASLATVTSASGKDLTFTGRTFIWQATFDALSERPILGYGLGGILFDDPISPKTAEVWRAIGFRVPHAHNGVLDIAIQLGIVGVIIFTLLFLSTMVDGVRRVRDQPTVAAWIVATLVTQLYMSLSENAFLGSGWLAILVMFRILLLRQAGMELATGRDLADRLRRTRSPSTRGRSRELSS